MSPALGIIAASSAQQSAPVIVITPARAQATRSQPGEPTKRADSADVMKMPDPIIELHDDHRGVEQAELANQLGSRLARLACRRGHRVSRLRRSHVSNQRGELSSRRFEASGERQLPVFFESQAIDHPKTGS